MKDSKILLAATIVLLAMFVHSALRAEAQATRASSDNLVSNGGFETISESRPEAWEEDLKGGWEVEMANSHRGNNSLKATVEGSWLSQEIPVRAEADYTLRAYVKSDIAIPEKEDYYNAFLTLECLNWRKKVIKREWGIVNATSSWQLKENTIFTPPGTRKIRIKLAKREGEGSVWFDDVKLVEAPPGLVLNGGFEILNGSDKPKFWKEGSHGGWTPDTEGPYQGERSMQATVAWSWLSQEILARPERYYTLRVYVKSDMAIPEKEDYYNAFLTLECLNWRKKVIKREWGIVNATSSWELKENLISTPAGTRKIRMKLAKRQGEGSVWFDDVELMEVPPGPVGNGGFEILNGSDKPKFWKEGSHGGWKVSEEVVYQGDRAMRAARGWSWLWQDVPVKPKRWYTLEAQIKSDIMLEEKPNRNNTFLTLECLDKKSQIIKREWGIVTAFPLWHKRENRIYTPENTRKIRIKLAKRQGEGSVWFDDVKLVERLFLAGKLPDKLTPFFNFLMYFLLAFSFLIVVFKIRSKSKSNRS